MTLQFTPQRPNHFPGCPCNDCAAWDERAHTRFDAVNDHKDVLQQIRAIGGEQWLTEQDLGRFNKAAHRVLDFMADGAWHSAEDIIAASRQREGLRRMRSLRDAGAKIEVLRKGNRFLYRLTGWTL